MERSEGAGRASRAALWSQEAALTGAVLGRLWAPAAQRLGGSNVVPGLASRPRPLLVSGCQPAGVVVEDMKVEQPAWARVLGCGRRVMITGLT